MTKTSIAICLLAAGCASAPGGEDVGASAEAMTIAPFPQWYMLRSKTFGHCLEDKWATLATEGADFAGHQATFDNCNGFNVSQAYRFTTNAHIVNGRAGCLDAWNLLGQYGVVADSACSANALGERWEQWGDGLLHNLGENWCMLDSTTGSRQGVESVRMGVCNDLLVAGWDWVPLPDPGVPAQKYVYAAMQGTRCLDAGWPSAVAGRQLQTWDCNGSTAQQFQWNPFTRTIKDLASGMCLDADAGATNGAVVREWPCNGYLNQQWQVTNDGQIASYLNAGCLEVAGASSDNGAAIQTWSCWGGLNQQWTHWQ